MKPEARKPAYRHDLVCRRGTVDGQEISGSSRSFSRYPPCRALVDARAVALTSSNYVIFAGAIHMCWLCAQFDARLPRSLVAVQLFAPLAALRITQGRSSQHVSKEFEMFVRARMCVVLGMVATMASAAMGTVANFDNLSLAADTHWDGSGNWDGSTYPATPATSPDIYNDSFTSGSFTFNNRFETHTGGEPGFYWHYTSWSGWAYSNEVETTGSGSGYQFDAKPGSAASGDNFGVLYHSAWGGVTPTATLAEAAVLSTVKLTNSTYCYDSMLNGDGFATPMAAGDWAKVIITGKDTLGAATGSIDFYVADFRAGSTLIVDTWETVDLSGLGEVSSLEFTMDSYDASTGFAGNWPTYVLVDNLIPEPTTVCLLTTGGVALALRRRRNKKA